MDNIQQQILTTLSNMFIEFTACYSSSQYPYSMFHMMSQSNHLQTKYSLTTVVKKEAPPPSAAALLAQIQKFTDDLTSFDTGLVEAWYAAYFSECCLDRILLCTLCGAGQNLIGLRYSFIKTV